MRVCIREEVCQRIHDDNRRYDQKNREKAIGSGDQDGKKPWVQPRVKCFKTGRVLIFF